jgi:hypothetical protein
MGYLVVGHNSTDTVVEFNTTACVHCGGVLIQETRYIGGRPVRTTVTITSGGERIQEVDEGYYCGNCQGEACIVCGQRAMQGLEVGPCNFQDKNYELVIARR